MKLTIDLTNTDDIKAGVTLCNSILGNQGPNFNATEEVVDDPIDNFDTEPDSVVEDDFMSDIMPDDDTAITVDDMKNAVSKLRDAKGQDIAKSIVVKMFGKLKVKKLEDVPDDKREALVKALNTVATS